MGIVKNNTDIRSLKEAGQITKDVLQALKEASVTGVSTIELETLANRLLAGYRSTAPFKTFEGFNHAICVSINDEIVNGPPSRERILRDGDVVSIATAAEHRGIYAKAARTVYVGAQPLEDISRLLQGTGQVLQNAISKASTVTTLNDLLTVVPETAREFGLTVIAGLGGAGIGKKLHDWPAVPNDPSSLEEIIPLQPGLCFTLMPMFSLGKDIPYKDHEDGWTLLTGDQSFAAHIADTLLMTAGGLQNITA